MFSCEFCENSKKTFFIEHFWMTASKMSNSPISLFHKFFSLKRLNVYNFFFLPITGWAIH